MIPALIAVGSIFVFLLVVEYICRRYKLRGEISRKFVHIVIGSFIAFWLFFMPVRTVLVLCLALLLVVLLSKVFHIFQSIHSVRRFTLGELFFPAGIAVAAILADNAYIFLAAVLHMSLADGLAGLVGVHFIRQPGHYRVFGHIKTVAGSLTFFITSVLIIGWLFFYSGVGYSPNAWPAIILLPVIATYIENFSPDGSDNLFVPIVVAGLLNYIKFIS